MRPCSIGFSLSVFPVAGSPGFQSGGARLQACGKSASTRRASAPARAQWHSHSWLCACGLRAVHLPPSSPLFVFSPLVYPELRGATRLPCLPRACLPQAGFEGSEVEGPLLFTVDGRPCGERPATPPAANKVARDSAGPHSAAYVLNSSYEYCRKNLR